MGKQKKRWKQASFWVEYEKNEEHRVDIHTVTEEAFKQRHECMLSLIDKYDPLYIGLYIGGKYYRGIWNSRSASKKLYQLMQIKTIFGPEWCDEKLFYASSSIYHSILVSPQFEEIRKTFEEADKADRMVETIEGF